MTDLRAAIGGVAWGSEPKYLNNPEPFFPDSAARSVDDAKAICATCPVTQKCFELALANDERHGIWGGVNFGSKYKGVERQAALRNSFREFEKVWRIRDVGQRANIVEFRSMVERNRRAAEDASALSAETAETVARMVNEIQAGLESNDPIQRAEASAALAKIAQAANV